MYLHAINTSSDEVHLSIEQLIIFFTLNASVLKEAIMKTWIFQL